MIAAVFTLAPFQFPLLVINDQCDDVVRYVEVRQDLLIQYQHTATGDSTHGEFLVPRDAQFPHHKDIEWGVQLACNFVGNRNAATRQAQHNYICSIGETIEFCRQEPARVSSVLENLDEHDFTRSTFGASDGLFLDRLNVAGLEIHPEIRSSAQLPGQNQLNSTDGA